MVLVQWQGKNGLAGILRCMEPFSTKTLPQSGYGQLLIRVVAASAAAAAQIVPLLKAINRTVFPNAFFQELGVRGIFRPTVPKMANEDVFLFEHPQLSGSIKINVFFHPDWLDRVIWAADWLPPVLASLPTTATLFWGIFPIMPPLHARVLSSSGSLFSPFHCLTLFPNWALKEIQSIHLYPCVREAPSLPVAR